MSEAHKIGHTTIIESVARQILGSDDAIPNFKKAALSLYFINLIRHSSQNINDYCLLIGDENILQELLLDLDLLDYVCANFSCNNYTEIGRSLSYFLMTRSQKFETSRFVSDRLKN